MVLGKKKEQRKKLTALTLAKIIYEEIEKANAWEAFTVFWFSQFVFGLPTLEDDDTPDEEEELLVSVLESISDRIYNMKVYTN